MPPPPWELLMTDKPSIRDGLQLKLLDSAPLQFAVLTLLSVRSTLSRGNAAGVAPSVHGYSPSGTNTPFDTTVIPAPSYAPRRVGSCSCSARLPFSPASRPSMASSGKRSTCGLEVVGLKEAHPAPQPESSPSGTPVVANPNRHTTRL